MVADELAIRLNREFVRAGDVLMDPFCGSGRMLTASCELPGERIGIDVNPLACLIARAKLAKVDPAAIKSLARDCSHAATRSYAVTPLVLGSHRKVDWFSQTAASELAEIVAWANSSSLSEPEHLVLAASLSAVARDVSFARKTAWKLHRLGEAGREAQTTSAWEALRRRLDYCASVVDAEVVECASHVYQADCTRFDNLGEWKGKVDVVLTSPPYGDSRTTVQYGAASELCLEVVSQLTGFEGYASHGGLIDSSCLGGAPLDLPDERLPMFWSGRRESVEARAAGRFLTSLSKACSTVADALRPGGLAIFVVGRRSTGGYRLRLDEFLCDEMGSRGFEVEVIKRRALKWKRAPQHINRFAKSASAEKRATGVLPTMKDEIIVGFRKPMVADLTNEIQRVHPSAQLAEPQKIDCRR